MAQFDVYKNQDGYGYLLVVQADLLNDLNTRMVVPLLPDKVAPIPARILNPCFVINGEKQVMSTQFMAAVPAGILHVCLGNKVYTHAAKQWRQSICHWSG